MTARAGQVREMTGYHGGQTVRQGIYVRLRPPVLMVVGSLVGLAYVILLPVTFWLGSVSFLGRQTGRMLKITRG